MLISKETSNALDTLLGAFFDLNRTLDRCVSWMQNVWSMSQAADIVHHKLAHLMPLFSDKVSEIKDRYNMASVYPATHADARQYADLSEMFEVVLEEFAEVYKIIQMTRKIVIEQDDVNVLTDLYDILEDYNIIMGQIYTLRDKANQMPDQYDTFDRHISSWGIKGIDLGE